MSQLNAFVGHSFAAEDHEVVEAILKFLNQVKGMNIGFSWESAEPAEPKDLADKVRALIQDKNVFIGICTRKVAAIEPTHLSSAILNRKLLRGYAEHFSWKTSDWIIQEIGLAIGRGMDIILLIEDGLRPPGGLQGNLEYIQFERSVPQRSFGKLLEMIQALLPKAKAMPSPEAGTAAVAEERQQPEEKKSLEWLEPKEDWTRKDYDLALLRAIIIRDAEREKRIAATYLDTEDGQISANRESLEARQEELRLRFGEGGTLNRLQELALKYRDNSNVQRSLALGYRHYEEHEKAGECFILVAEKAADMSTQFVRYRDALLDFAQAGRNEHAQEMINKMKTLISRVDDGETILINALRQLTEIQKNKDLLFGLTERLLQLHPDDVDSRFSLAYKYSEADHAELSLFHYLKIPQQQRTPVTWNNLGAEFDQFDLATKSVDAYRMAEELGESLAMSNLARKLLKAGFLKEAQEICNRALQVKDYHKNVGYAIQQIKSVPEEEDNKQKEVLDKAMPVSEFYRDYGCAAAQNETPDHTGRWRGPDCELQITIKGGEFLAQGEYEVKRSTLGLALFGMPTPAAPETDKYRIKYSGEIYGHTVKGTVIRQEIGKPIILRSLLPQMKDETQMRMVVSDALTEIRVYEKRASKEPLFYTLTPIE